MRLNINDNTYVEIAEDVIKKIGEERNGKLQFKLTTSKIRSILAMNSAIYNEVVQNLSQKLDTKIKRDLQYLKVRLVYEAGRETAVKKFVEEANLLELLDTIGESKERYLLFSRYLEALVAYHRYYGGSDK